jgi:hypothetical protein
VYGGTSLFYRLVEFLKQWVYARRMRKETRALAHITEALVADEAFSRTRT